MRKIVCTALALLGLWVPAPAQTLAPASTSKMTAILFVGPDGTLDDAAQQTWETPALHSLGTMSGLTWEPSTAIFRTTDLAPADRAALMAFPDALVASNRAPALLNTDYLFLLRMSDKDKHLDAELLDVAHDERYPLPPIQVDKPDQLMGRLAEAVHARLARMAQRGAASIVGNTESKMYHLASADHTDRSKLVPLKDERSALELGYRPCPICFPAEDTDHGTDTDIDAGQIGLLMTQVMKAEYSVGKMLDEPRFTAVAKQLGRSNQCGDEPLSFKGITTDDVFSISYTGGETFLSSGLEKILETPAEIAALEAHELAHVQQEHFLHYFRDAYVQNGPSSLLRVERPGSLGDFLLRLNRRLLREGFPVAMEEEADGYAIQYMMRAGYDPQVYAQTLHKIQEAVALAHHVKTALWTKIHPLPPERLARLAVLPAQLGDIAALEQRVARFDAGAVAAMQIHAVALAPHLATAHQFAAALEAHEGTSPVTRERGEPTVRH